MFRIPARALGLSELSRVGKVAFTAFALLFASGAFLLVLWHAWRRTLSLRTVLLLGIAFHVVAVALPPLLAEDVFLYARFGRIAGIHHANPYPVAPAHFPADPFIAYIPPEWRHFRSLYGPAFILWSELITNTIRSVGAVVFAFKLAAGLSSVGTMLLVAWLARRVWPLRAPFAVAVLALNPIVMFDVVGGAHNDAFVALAMVSALALATLAGDRSSPKGWVPMLGDPGLCPLSG